MKDLSLIVSVYNSEKYLSRCLDSILRQDPAGLTYDLLLVDDGSSDNSLVIAKAYQQKHQQIRIVAPGDHIGLGRTRNLGISEAAGRYIWFLDADDEIMPDSFRLLAKELSHGNDIIIFEMWLDKVNGKKVSFSLPKYPTNKQVLLTVNPSACNKLFRRDFIKGTGISFPASIRHQDFATIFRFIAEAGSLRYLDSPLYLYYRFQPGSISSQAHNFNTLNSDILEAAKYLIDYAFLKEQYLAELFYIVHDEVSIQYYKWLNSYASNKDELIEKYSFFIKSYEKYFMTNHYISFWKATYKTIKQQYDSTFYWRTKNFFENNKKMLRNMRNTLIKGLRQRIKVFLKK
jgi:glycosyltransferase involved in cell wall biosynthesis